MLLMRDYSINISNIFNHYGLESQKQQLIQELAELILAITKNDEENIIEEFADVQVMIDQFFKCKYSYSDLLKIKLQKVERQLARIEKEKKNGKI